MARSLSECLAQVGNESDERQQLFKLLPHILWSLSIEFRLLDLRLRAASDISYVFIGAPEVARVTLNV
eukprot:307962-Pyramimonas_sp.AAC.1